MPKDLSYLFERWDDELLNVAYEAVECAIASAYLSQDGVDFLSKVANRLARFTTSDSGTIIKVLLSDKFAPTKAERLEILKRMAELPGVEARIYCGSKFLHNKNYIFRTKDEIRIVVGSVNVTRAGLFKNLETAALTIHDKDDPEAKKIISNFESIWLKSKSLEKYREVEEMTIDKPRFQEGENVRYIAMDKIGTINKVIKGTRSHSYKVTIDGKVRIIGERFLEPYEDVEDRIVVDFTSGNFGGHTDYNLFQTSFRLSRPLESNLYSYLGSKTIFNPHQFKPLLRFLSPGSDDRLFIADEVGVGKTIETGIIITELLARGRLDYHSPIFVVCPNSLGPKWVKEMKDRFGLPFHFHDGKSLKYTLLSALNESHVPQMYIFSVVGLQLIRHENYLSLLREIDARRESPLFELIVIDEAHHMRNSETDSNEVGTLLGNLTELMLMLSATPLNLRNEDIYNQMHILNPVAFPDLTTFQTLQEPVILINRIRNLITKNTLESREEILSALKELLKTPLGRVISSHDGVKNFIDRLKDKTIFSVEEAVRYERLFITLSPLFYSFTRSRKREALEHQVAREVLELGILLSDDELRFHNDILKAIEKYYISRGGDPQAIGFVTNTHRRMISSCIPAMREYLEWCVGGNQFYATFEEISDELEDDSDLDVIPLDPALKDEFTRLLNETKKLEKVDSKYNQFRQMLDKILSNPETPQVIVFSFFVGTLEYLKRRLEVDGFSVGIIHGKVPLERKGEQQGRYEIMEQFKQGDFKVLLSSEVGGEGLDFQFCHCIINYDLPYNPMRVEQRIGRVDRFGQQSPKIIVGNLFIKGTIDEEIYDRLYRRIRLIEDGIGALEPILGKELSNIQTELISGKLTVKQKEELSERIEKAVAAKKIEMEEFEKYRKELLSDDYLSEPINSITKGNFISPEDAIQLTVQCLSRWKGCNFKQTTDSCGEISLSGDVITKLNKFLRRPGNEGGYNELQVLLSEKERIKAVFDGSKSDNYPDHIFLSPTGYWSKFLTYQLEKEGLLLKTFSFRVKSPEIKIPKGVYLVFLFEVRFEGLRTEIEFLALPVDVNSNSVVETDFENLPRIIGRSKCVNVSSNPYDLDPNLYLDAAREYLEKVLDDKRINTSQENRYKIESRITALKRSSEIKVEKRRQEIENHKRKRIEEGKKPDSNYIRLTEARIEKEKSRLESKIKELEKFQELSLDYNLEGIIYLEL